MSATGNFVDAATALAWGLVNHVVPHDELLPTALASMTAKYHRELAMHAFNAFWTTKLPGLKPTAGYPNDAKRFREEIASLQRELSIDDRMIWRSR